MSASLIISEITELKEPRLVYRSKSPRLLSSKANRDESIGKKHVHPVEDDLYQLIEERDHKDPSRAVDPSHPKGMDLLRKSALKKQVRVSTSQASGLGISESVTLKQALRKLCISQASEMAAMKRLSNPIGVSVASEASTIKRLYATVVVQASISGNEDQQNLLEVSLVPEKITSKLSGKIFKSSKIATTEPCIKASESFSTVCAATVATEVKPKIRDVICAPSVENRRNPSPGIVPWRVGKIKPEPSVSISNTGSDSVKSIVSPRLMKPALRNKNCPNIKGNRDFSSTSGSSIRSNCADRIASSPRSKPGTRTESASSVPTRENPNNVKSLKKDDTCERQLVSNSSNCNNDGAIGTKRKEISRSREKGECSHSSKSSIGDYSSSTSISDESNQSGSSAVGIRPHMSNDVRWAAIRQVEARSRSIGLKNFRLLKRLGCGDIGTVYLAELTGLDCLFALKVMDNEFLISRKKMVRAQTEREILQMLDHPFLPTLYTHFTTDNLSCLVMEYCPGGDLHVLRQKQQGRSFSEPAARFYVAEVLLALEYLHMLGVVYRDLKPENILVREDGHIMLSDFDLSLRCIVNPTLPRLSSVGTVEVAARTSGVCAESYCIDPLCLHPSWAQGSCFTPRLMSSTAAKNRKLKFDFASHGRLPQLVVEPTEARSNSFVGTHEYLAPEIIKGEGHGSSVDWWTFGIFLYELLFGRTPFKGLGNEETLANVVAQSFKFPDTPAVSFHAKDLIRGLLVKEPENRLGSVRGAAEIKRHPFFTGMNWALIRCATPPEVPHPYDDGIPSAEPPQKKDNKPPEFRTDGDGTEFELF